jgi:diguanylate cyclase (GGDEF)-like protein
MQDQVVPGAPEQSTAKENLSAPGGRRRCGRLGLWTVGDMAKRISRALSRDDVICRHGGEEFAIILPESNAIQAAMRADLLRGEARKIEIRYQGQLLNPVTFSVGVAASPDAPPPKKYGGLPINALQIQRRREGTECP